MDGHLEKERKGRNKQQKIRGRKEQQAKPNDSPPLNQPPTTNHQPMTNDSITQ
jgi:hypothetical protein